MSVFTSLQGGRQASIKLFSTGKIRCLKSDFKSQEHAQQCAQGIIDEMSNMPNSGMPRVTLSDAKVGDVSRESACIQFMACPLICEMRLTSPF